MQIKEYKSKYHLQGIKEAYKFLELLIENARQDKIQALEANESKSLFLANMSHEIRTPRKWYCGLYRATERVPS